MGAKECMDKDKKELDYDSGLKLQTAIDATLVLDL